jgi:hypothetical protein
VIKPDPADLGFSFQVSKAGEVAIRRGARVVTVLRGARALEFVAEVRGLTGASEQQVMARVTGNYKRGNERAAARHPRNRARGGG